MRPNNSSVRPAQLSTFFLTVWGILLGLSFVTGLFLWWAKVVQSRQFEPPPWAHWVRTMHGVLNPVLCVGLGYLWHKHMRAGWRMGVNRGSGLAVAGILAGLIGTGAGLYYAGGAWMYWGHLGLGVSLPLALGYHSWAGTAWARKLSPENGG